MEKLPFETEPRNAVDPVAHYWEIDRSQVHSDLVRAAGLEPHAQERVRGKKSLELEVRHGVARRRRVERVPCRVMPIAADGRLDPTAARPGATPDEGEILALQRPPADEALEAAEGLFAPGDNEQPGRVAV